MSKRIIEQFELAKKQAEKADMLFDDDGMLPEALMNMFALIENCANIVKDIYNNFPQRKHYEANQVLIELYLRKILKQDYSKYHEALNDYRAKAYFGEYSIKMKVLPPKSSLKVYLDKGKELFNETKTIFDERMKGKNK